MTYRGSSYSHTQSLGFGICANVTTRNVEPHRALNARPERSQKPEIKARVRNIQKPKTQGLSPNPSLVPKLTDVGLKLLGATVIL